MRNLRVSLLGIFFAAILALAGTSTASAAITFEVYMNAAGTPTYNRAENLDPSLCTTMRAMRGLLLLDRDDQNSSQSAEVNTALQPGDVLELWQYAGPCVIPPAWPAGAPTRSYTVPTINSNAVAGGTTVTGAAPDGQAIYVVASDYCRMKQVSVLATRSPGAYSATLPFALSGQSNYRARTLNASGDLLDFSGKVPGDSRCIVVDAARNSNTSITPYGVSVEGLDPAVAPNTRIRLVRGGVEVASVDDDELELTVAQMPMAGDVVEVYRPKTAVAPAYSFTVPNVSGKFDPGNDLVAVDGPAASRIFVIACRPIGCIESYDAMRGAYNVPAGRTLFDFSSPTAGIGEALDIFPGDMVQVQWGAESGLGQVEFDLVEGDLTSPVGKVKLKSKLKAKGLTKKLKFKLTSNEAGSVSAKLTVPSVKGTTSAKKKAVKQITLASGKGKVKVGSNTISLKTTKAGKKSLKKIARSRKGASATLTITLTDASGNATTIVKGIKLK